MSSLIEMGQKAKDAAVVLATLSTPLRKIKALLASADALLAAKAEILAKIRQMWMRQWKQASRVHLSTD